MSNKTLVVQLQLLDNCNLKCKHCYVGEKLFKPRISPDTNKVKKWLIAINKFSKDFGFKNVDIHFSGGEPLLRKDIFELIRFCKDNDMDMFVLSNGVLFNSEIGRNLKESGLDYIQFSLEGPKEENDYLRGKGVYEKVISSIKIAKSLGIKPTVSLTLSKHNIDVVKDFIRELDEMDIMFHIREYFPINQSKSNLIKEISLDERKDFFEFVRDYKGLSRVKPEDPIQCSIKNGTIRDGGCSALKSHFCVDVDGSILPCRILEKKVGHVDDIKSAYLSDIGKKFRKRNLEGKCGNCNFSNDCGGCRAYSFLRTGNLFSQDLRCFKSNINSDKNMEVI